MAARLTSANELNKSIVDQSLLMLTLNKGKIKFTLGPCLAHLLAVSLCAPLLAWVLVSQLVSEQASARASYDEYDEGQGKERERTFVKVMGRLAIALILCSQHSMLCDATTQSLRAH